MTTSDDKVGGWVKKGQNHDDVILEWSLRYPSFESFYHIFLVQKPPKLDSLYFVASAYKSEKNTN